MSDEGKATDRKRDGWMDKLRRLCGSKSITGDRDKDLSKGGFSRKRGGERNRMKKIIAPLMVVVLALTSSVSAGAGSIRTDKEPDKEHYLRLYFSEGREGRL